MPGNRWAADAKRCSNSTDGEVTATEHVKNMPSSWVSDRGEYTTASRGRRPRSVRRSFHVPFMRNNNVTRQEDLVVLSVSARRGGLRGGCLLSLPWNAPGSPVVIVCAGIAGLRAAHEFRKQRGPHSRILILENHAMIGGEAKHNEFDVGGVRLLGPQGSNDFGLPKPGGTARERPRLREEGCNFRLGHRSGRQQGGTVATAGRPMTGNIRPSVFPTPRVAVHWRREFELVRAEAFHSL